MLLSLLPEPLIWLLTGMPFFFYFLSVCILAFVRDRTCYQLLGKFNLHIFTWHVLLDHFSVSWQNIICVSLIPLTLIKLTDDKQNLMKVDTTLLLQKEARILQFTKDVIIGNYRLLCNYRSLLVIIGQYVIIGNLR